MKTLTKTLVLAAVAVVAFNTAAHAASTKTACQQVVQNIKGEWKAVDYPTPSKPSAVRVQGKYGHENSAGQIAYMQEQIKQAEADCNAGKQQAALQRVSSIRDLLDTHGISQETANAAMAQQQ